MKKFRKLFAMGLAAVMAISTISISAFADENVNEYAGLTIVEGMIDYSIYGSDMVYVQEDADAVTAYNESLKSNGARAVSFSQWSWSRGIYSSTTYNIDAYTIPYYFVPTTSSMYFNAQVTGVTSAPRLAVNKLLSDGTLEYVGAYPISSAGNNTYEWTNYSRPLTAGQKYVFTLRTTAQDWEFASIDIYKSAM